MTGFVDELQNLFRPWLFETVLLMYSFEGEKHLIPTPLRKVAALSFSIKTDAKKF